MPDIELIHIDCMQYMATIEDNAFDLAIVDPPYGIGMDKGHDNTGIDARDGKKILRRGYSDKWDSSPPDASYFNELIRVSKNQIIWGGNFFAEKLPKATHWIFWDKLNPMPSFGDGELAYTSIKRKSIKKMTIRYWGHQTAGEKERIHPTQKPIKLYSMLLKEYAKPGDRILDTHLGSGSSAIAAHYGGFDFVGCELSEHYITAARARFESETSQTAMEL